MMMIFSQIVSLPSSNFSLSLSLVCTSFCCIPSSAVKRVCEYANESESRDLRLSIASARAYSRYDFQFCQCFHSVDSSSGVSIDAISLFDRKAQLVPLIFGALSRNYTALHCIFVHNWLLLTFFFSFSLASVFFLLPCCIQFQFDLLCSAFRPAAVKKQRKKERFTRDILSSENAVHTIEISADPRSFFSCVSTTYVFLFWNRRNKCNVQLNRWDRNTGQEEGTTSHFAKIHLRHLLWTITMTCCAAPARAFFFTFQLRERAKISALHFVVQRLVVLIKLAYFVNLMTFSQYFRARSFSLSRCNVQTNMCNEKKISQNVIFCF